MSGGGGGVGGAPLLGVALTKPNGRKWTGQTLMDDSLERPTECFSTAVAIGRLCRLSVPEGRT